MLLDALFQTFLETNVSLHLHQDLHKNLGISLVHLLVEMTIHLVNKKTLADKEHFKNLMQPRVLLIHMSSPGLVQLLMKMARLLDYVPLFQRSLIMTFQQVQGKCLLLPASYMKEGVLKTLGKLIAITKGIVHDINIPFYFSGSFVLDSIIMVINIDFIPYLDTVFPQLVAGLLFFFLTFKVGYKSRQATI